GYRQNDAKGPLGKQQVFYAQSARDAPFSLLTLRPRHTARRIAFALNHCAKCDALELFVIRRRMPRVVA
ncbi:MAG: hypothetical protein ACREAC_01420, partial [Blastocatellia bacterium]